MSIGTVDNRYSAFRHSTERNKKHQFLSCAEDLEDVATLLVLSQLSHARPPGIPVLKVKNPPPLRVKIPENSRYENIAYASRV